VILGEKVIGDGGVISNRFLRLPEKGPFQRRATRSNASKPQQKHAIRHRNFV